MDCQSRPSLSMQIEYRWRAVLLRCTYYPIREEKDSLNIF